MFNSTLASEYTLNAPAFAVERQRAAVLVACLARLVSEVWTVHFISLQSLRFWTAHFSHLCSLSRVPGQKKKKEKEIWCRLTDLVFLVEEAMCSFSSQRLCAAIRWECKIQAMTPMWCCFFFFFVLCLPRFCKRGRESLMPLYRVCFKTMNARFTLPLFSPTPLYVLTVLKEV